MFAHTPAAPVKRKGRLKQSLFRTVFGQNTPGLTTFDEQCREAVRLGAYGFDLVGPQDWPTMKKYGLVPTMGPMSFASLTDGLVNKEQWPKVEKALRGLTTPIRPDEMRLALDRLMSGGREILLVHSSLSSCGWFTAGPDDVLRGIGQCCDTLVFPIYLPGDFRAPLVDPLTATGPAVLEIFANPTQYAGKTLPVLGEFISPNEMVETFQRVTGKKAEYRSAYKCEEFLEYFPAFGANEMLVQEIIGMVEYAVENGYFVAKSDFKEPVGPAYWERPSQL